MRPSRFHVLEELSEFSPVELAALARGRRGLLFFDSAREGAGSGEASLLALEPNEVLEGDLFEEGGFERLRSVVLREQEREWVDDGLPGPIVAGGVRYDGRYWFGVYSQVLLYRHAEEKWYGSGDWWRGLLEEGERLRQAPQGVEPWEGRLDFRSQLSKESFCEMVRRAQAYIAAGDIYQVNLSHVLEAHWAGGDPWPVYEALRHLSPAPYGAFLDLGPGPGVLLSTSPELFLQFSGRVIRTRPIKGTRPRRADPLADERSAFDLITSPKEVSELVMITDLERNDLGQVCEWGSVSVRELLKLERHEQVFHLVSTVEGRLRPEVDGVTALRACFPGGSITGAPKRRAREIIAELEPHRRGWYTGVVGWFGARGESQFSILIRTMEFQGGVARFCVGAGVVADSVPEQEWQETWDKAAGLLLAARWRGQERWTWVGGGGSP